MAKKLTKEEWLCRARAYEEAAQQVGFAIWTDDPTEKTQGKFVASRLDIEAGRCRERAAACEV